MEVWPVGIRTNKHNDRIWSLLYRCVAVELEGVKNQLNEILKVFSPAVKSHFILLLLTLSSWQLQNKCRQTVAHILTSNFLRFSCKCSDYCVDNTLYFVAFFVLFPAEEKNFKVWGQFFTSYGVTKKLTKGTIHPPLIKGSNSRSRGLFKRDTF